MEIKEYYIEKNVAHALIGFSVDEVNQKYQSVFEYFKPNFSIPGFRKGKIPYELFKKYVDPLKFYEEVMYQFLRAGTDFLWKEKKEEEWIQAPSLDGDQLPKENETFSLKLKGDIFPKIDLPELDKIKIPLLLDRTEEAIEQEKITALLDANATFSEASGDPKNGQYLLLDYQFSNDKEKLDPKELKPAMIEIGKNLLYPDTDERILSVKMGDTEILSLADENKEPLYLQVKPVALKNKELPELNQEFLDSIHAEKTVDQFKEETQKTAKTEYENYLINKKIDAFFEQVLKTLTIENIPTILIDHQIDEEIYELESNLIKSKLTMDEFLAKTGKTLETLKEEYKPKAEFLAKVNLVFRALANQYPELRPTKDYIDTEKKIYMGKYNKDEINEYELERFIEENAVKKNAIHLIADKVDFTIEKK